MTYVYTMGFCGLYDLHADGDSMPDMEDIATPVVVSATLIMDETWLESCKRRTLDWLDSDIMCEDMREEIEEANPGLSEEELDAIVHDPIPRTSWREHEWEELGDTSRKRFELVCSGRAVAVMAVVRSTLE